VRTVIEEVRGAMSRWDEFAEAAEVPRRVRREVARSLQGAR
jgi:hypothetical protein